MVPSATLAREARMALQAAFGVLACKLPSHFTSCAHQKTNCILPLGNVESLEAKVRTIAPFCGLALLTLLTTVLENNIYIYVTIYVECCKNRA